MSLSTLLAEISLRDRIGSVDQDFLSYEIDHISPEDEKLIISAVGMKLPNPHNSILLYVLGISDEFDHEKGRSDMIGGSPPDIDMDYSALRRHEVIQGVTEFWGEEQVAGISAHQTFKLKSVARDFYRVTEGDPKELAEILNLIPPPVFGKEASLDKVLKEHPEIKTKYEKFYRAARTLEGMVKRYSIHAGGILVANEPITNYIPTFTKNDVDENGLPVKRRITQFDKDAVEELGLLKLDFLAIDSLDVINQCLKLIGDPSINPWDLPQADKPTVALFKAGLLGGVFQMETSQNMKDMVLAFEPYNIDDLAIITSTIRPGPMEAGWHLEIIERKNNGTWESDNPAVLDEVLDSTFGLMIYQEQLMQCLQVTASFTLLEADKVRKAVGKKKPELLEKYQEVFVGRAVAEGHSETWARSYWEKIKGFGAYGFNRAHAVSYSYITWASAYLKANYPRQFFCALLSVKAKVMQPADWATRAPEYIREAGEFGIHVFPPSVNSSVVDFAVSGDDIWFGLSGIRAVGQRTSELLIAARGSIPFTDIWDFVDRVKINSRVFQSLIIAGCFDCLGYRRADLLESYRQILNFPKEMAEYEQRLIDHRERERTREEKLRAKESLEEKIRAARKVVREHKRKKNPGRPPTSEELEYASYPERIKEIRGLVKIAETPDFLSEENKKLWELFESFKRKPGLRLKEKPTKVKLEQSEKLDVSLEETLMQGFYIGCFIGKHPTEYINIPALQLSELEDGYQDAVVLGVIASLKEVTTKAGKKMAFGMLEDGTDAAEIILFPRVWERVAKKADELMMKLVVIKGSVREGKIIINKLELIKVGE